jgi:hypothetical protein
MNYNMTFKDWLSFKLDPKEMIVQGNGPGLQYFLGLEKEKKSAYDTPISHLLGLQFRLEEKFNNLSQYDFSQVNTQSCYCNFTIRQNRRKEIIETIKDKNFTTEGQASPSGKELGAESYINSLIKHRFCVSPEGNGEDCHRHYESLILKSIPIIEDPDSPCPDKPWLTKGEDTMRRWKLPSRIKDKYEDLPVLYTSNYKEINNDYLDEQYEKILNTTYNFEKLTRSYWLKESFLGVIEFNRTGRWPT